MKLFYKLCFLLSPFLCFLFSHHQNNHYFCAENSPRPIYFNNFIRFEQNAYVNPPYKSPNNEVDKVNYQLNADRKCDDVKFYNEQCYQYARTNFWVDSQVSSTTNNNNNDAVMDGKPTEQMDEIGDARQQGVNCFSNPKYKNQIMEKYLRGLEGTPDCKGKRGLELSKWLEGAAKFTPEKNNYIEWDSKKLCSKTDEYHDQYIGEANINNIHQKEELDAAEALTFLAGNFKSRWVK